MRLALAAEPETMMSAHFGRCPAFIIVDIEEHTYTWRIIESRENASVSACKGNGHNSASFAEILKLVGDCQTVIALQIGNFARRELVRRNISVLERGGLVPDLLDRYAAYLKKWNKN
ncbi:MAG: NifB/NifX family molybdenum-iron cluster-binding protein [Syntrophomonadaceae bacterium]|jgi:predicted Fe-Mo cluster-binding NifX family protein|nr:NifB/NifX family molybdenum-iron cluster-binding protein [Syntrophomonadaceae bacterium]